MMEMGMEEHKVFYTVEEIASDLCIRKGEAAELVKKMHRELKAAGKLTIAGKVPIAWYERQKEYSFLEGWQQPEHIPLTEKRLLNLKEFCTYSGMGQHMAREFAKGTGIEKYFMTEYCLIDGAIRIRHLVYRMPCLWSVV